MFLGVDVQNLSYNNAMQFHCTEIKQVSNKYTQNKQLFRYFVQRLCKASGTKLNYEVKVANAEEVKNTIFVSCWDSI